MTDEQITAIAREYAEETIKGTDFDDMPGSLRRSVLEMNAKTMEKKLKWLLRRYCLVEKEGLKKKYAELESEWMMAKGTDVYIVLLKIEFFESLFPEIAKEVEG